MKKRYYPAETTLVKENHVPLHRIYIGYDYYVLYFVLCLRLFYALPMSCFTSTRSIIRSVCLSRGIDLANVLSFATFRFTSLLSLYPSLLSIDLVCMQ